MATSTIQYKGFADERSLTKADLKKLGLEDASGVTFLHGVATEVPSEVAKVLLSHDVTKNDFVESKVDAPAEEPATDKPTTTKSPAKG